MKVLKRGDRGKEVLDVQSRLRALDYDLGTDGVDGMFGSDTQNAVLLFQQNSGLLADGIIGENTWCELVESRYEPGERLLYLRIPPFRGADVLFLQRSLNRLGFNAGPEDGILGTMTEKAVLDFQKNAGLITDGMVDESVLRVMAKVTKDGKPHSSEGKIPDRHGGYTHNRGMEGTLFALDPGHGGSDPGITFGNGQAEKQLNLELARLLAKQLGAAGAKVLLTRDVDQDLGLYERPAAANIAAADFFISLHHNSSESRTAQGASACYFSREGYFSEAGRMLAEHIVTELSKYLGVVAIPALGRNYTVLRETEMTAVLIEPVFISDLRMQEELKDGHLLDREAESIFNGLRKYLSTSGKKT